MGYVQYVANAFSPRLLSIVYCWWKLIGKSARSVMRTKGAINVGCGLVYWVQACIIQRPCFVPNDEPSLLDQIRPSPRSGPRLKYQVLARLWQKPESVVGHLPTTLIILDRKSVV